VASSTARFFASPLPFVSSTPAVRPGELAGGPLRARACAGAANGGAAMRARGAPPPPLPLLLLPLFVRLFVLQ
jgi:hypothetical protein